MKTIWKIAIGAGVVLFFAVVLFLQEKDGAVLIGTKILRPTDTESKTYEISWDAKEEGLSGTLGLELFRQAPTGDDLEALLEYAKDYVLALYPEGEPVYEDISFPKKVPETAVSLDWTPLDYKYLNYDGTRGENIGPEGEDVPVRVELTAYGESLELDIVIHLMPKTAVTTFESRLKTYIESLESDTNEEYIELPAEFEGVALNWKMGKSTAYKVLFFLPLVPVFVILAEREKRRKLQKERETQLLYDYPDIVSKFLLLLEAGLTVRAAWGQVAKGNTGGRAAYEELGIAYNEIENGVSEATACENFGRRCGLLPYIRFSSLIVQNLTKGSLTVLPLLEQEATDAFEERKEAAKRLGEEAGTKLLIPMVGMLMVILVMIMFSAFQNF